MRLPALLGLLPLLATGCQSSPTASQPPAPQPAHAEPVIVAGAGATTELARGELLRLELPGNPSTGYTWAIDGALPAQLAVESDLPEGPAPTASATPQVGAAQTQWLHFRAVQPGTAQLRLRWHRPWEADAAPARTASYTITVR